MIMGTTTQHDATSDQLDQEISDLQSQIAELKSQRKRQVTNIISSRTSQSILDRLRAPEATKTKKHPNDQNPLKTSLLENAKSQAELDQLCLYRTCAGVTTFKIQDPDPNAVGEGSVLGIRIEVGTTGKFIRPYYIMLNKPYPDVSLFRVHRHTVPARIPLATLSTRYLPAPKMDGTTITKSKKQDLLRFVRTLRKHIIAYHNRETTVKRMRKEFLLDEKASRKGKEQNKVIVDISVADGEAQHIRIEWADGKIGRCIVNDQGKVEKCVVIGEDGRDRETERRVLGGDQSMEGIAQRLKEGIY
ncbi:CENP-o kinetochore centromere component [Phlyctema vagabunda]|uniref:CENP-o kinetochore centromere component n=1 Tax=Phlyctema vagabunda TaxID=108571 RepID=A0ABR4PVM8_9HELO